VQYKYKAVTSVKWQSFTEILSLGIIQNEIWGSFSCSGIQFQNSILPTMKFMNKSIQCNHASSGFCLNSISTIVGAAHFAFTNNSALRNPHILSVTSILHIVCWLCPTEALWEHLLSGYRSLWQRHCGNTFRAGIGVSDRGIVGHLLSGYRSRRIKVRWMDKVIGLHVTFYWPELMDGHV
jgi:hypothetical protein